MLVFCLLLISVLPAGHRSSLETLLRKPADIIFVVFLDQDSSSMDNFMDLIIRVVGPTGTSAALSSLDSPTGPDLHHRSPGAAWTSSLFHQVLNPGHRGIAYPAGRLQGLSPCYPASLLHHGLGTLFLFVFYFVCIE
jgi:hypothetical protein